MASLIAQTLVKKTLKDTAQKNINSQNPYEEEVPVYGRDGRPTGKVKKRKRGIPTGLSPHDSSVLKKVRRRAYRLDMSLFNCCGIRFGWSSVVGIIPVIGDFIDCFLAIMLVRSCEKIEGGLPTMLRSRMVFNVFLDFLLGLVPFIGDIADAVYRANTRNAWLLEVYLTKKAEAEKRGQVSDPELGTHPMPKRPDPARLKSEPKLGS
ncbi:hypothetical protein VTK73DRAFT_5877 [Phialemonium thermophilum]|uniref:Uncharacterized protein n=1 Tax=Phialemonium thermophilum TaxID=223376 RepID=A0ABR3XXV1_9PEZI